MTYVCGQAKYLYLQLQFSRLYQGDLGFTRLQLSTCWNLQDELQTNPFLRPEEPALQAYTGKKDPVEVLGALRKKKDKL